MWFKPRLNQLATKMLLFSVSVASSRKNPNLLIIACLPGNRVGGLAIGKPQLNWMQHSKSANVDTPPKLARHLVD